MHMQALQPYRIPVALAARTARTQAACARQTRAPADLPRPPGVCASALPSFPAPLPLSRQGGGWHGERVRCKRPRMQKISAEGPTKGKAGADEEVEGEALYGIFDKVDFPGNKLVWVSAIFYVGMAGCSVVAGQFIGLDLTPDLLPGDGWVVPTVEFMLPLLALLTWSIFFGDEFEDVRELKELYAETLVPALATASGLGIGVMAAGAGFGEEMAFRGVMQQWLGTQLGDAGAAGQVAAIAVTALVFGAAHAVTRIYFLFATIAGVVFGVEYAMLDGNLWAPSMTHFLYDWVALYLLAKTSMFDAPPAKEEP